MGDAHRLVLWALLIGALSLLMTYIQGPASSQLSITSPQLTAASDDTDAIEVVIWAHGNPEEHWIVDGPLKVGPQVTDVKIKVTGIYYADNTDSFIERFEQAATVGQAPDIVVAGVRELRLWARAGYLTPFDTCRSKYAEFDDVIDRLWDTANWQGQTWGVPLEVRLTLLFFNKTKLKEIGWSEEEIAALPDKIKRGEFTQDDLLATAKVAIAKGVVEPGFGYWYRPSSDRYILHPYLAYGGRLYDPARDKLVINVEALVQWYTFQRRLVTERLIPDRLFDSTWQVGATSRGIYHDTVAHGRVLFWSGMTSFWGAWARQYAANLGGDAYLYDFVGYALYPSANKGQPGLTDASEVFYAITSAQASGRRHQDAACALLAKTTTPEINTLNAIENMTPGVLKSQVNDATYRQYPLLTETRYMLNYARSVPHPMNNLYRDILVEFMLKAETGDMLPVEAAAAAINQLQYQLGEAILVESR
ncbi:MAG: twin-arginine translocation pathway signal protein [Anaerolineae bacterium]|nr:twin-arginine translocation pathway signal protein [Anaerolineae bacterium]